MAEVLVHEFDNRKLRYTADSPYGVAIGKAERLMAQADAARAVLAQREGELAAVKRSIDTVACDADPQALTELLTLRTALEVLIPKAKARAEAAHAAAVGDGTVYALSRQVLRALERLADLTDPNINTNQSPTQRERETRERRAEIEQLTGIRVE